MFSCFYPDEYLDCAYEIDFKSGGYEYEYKIDAVTGEILEFEQGVDD